MDISSSPYGWKLNTLITMKLAIKLYTMVAVIVLFLGMFMINTVTAKADSTSTSSGLSFTVKTNLPDNQIDKNNDFYQLKMQPGQKQTITATIYNITQKETKVAINVQSASTTINGSLDYSKAPNSWDNSLKYKLSDMIRYPKLVTVDAGKSQDVSFEITMPNDLFNGILLGGITFNQADSDGVKLGRGASIQNRYAYAVAMVLKESDSQVKPNINLQRVTPGQNNGHNVLNVSFQNDQPLLMSNVQVNAKIYSEMGKKPVYSSRKSDMQMAPNSQFKYPVSLQGTPMQPGKYRIEATVTGTAYKTPKTWHFSRKFTIERQEAHALNQSDVDLAANTNNQTILFIAFAMIALLIILFMILLILKRKKSHTMNK